MLDVVGAGRCTFVDRAYIPRPHNVVVLEESNTKLPSRKGNREGSVETVSVATAKFALDDDTLFLRC